MPRTVSSSRKGRSASTPPSEPPSCITIPITTGAAIAEGRVAAQHREQDREAREREQRRDRRRPARAHQQSSRVRGDQLTGQSDQGLVADEHDAAEDRADREHDEDAEREATAVIVFAQKIWVRLTERVSTVFQVPIWSSPAKMSPATSAVRSGSTHWPAKPRISSGTDQPVWWM